MKTTTYTKPLRMPDNMPTRTSDVLTLTEDDGKVTKIERTIGGKTEEISTGDNRVVLKGAWNHEGDTTIDDPEGSTNALSILGSYIIEDVDMETEQAYIINTILPGVKEILIQMIEKWSPELVEPVKRILTDCVIACNTSKPLDNLTSILESSLSELGMDVVDYYTAICVDGPSVTKINPLILLALRSILLLLVTKGDQSALMLLYYTD